MSLAKGCGPASAVGLDDSAVIEAIERAGQAAKLDGTAELARLWLLLP